MNDNQDKCKIIQLGAEIDDDLEKQDVEKMGTYFSEDCKIEIQGLELKGNINLKK